MKSHCFVVFESGWGGKIGLVTKAMLSWHGFISFGVDTKGVGLLGSACCETFDEI